MGPLSPVLKVAVELSHLSFDRGGRLNRKLRGQRRVRSGIYPDLWGGRTEIPDTLPTRAGNWSLPIFDTSAGGPTQVRD
jgi:hypothetical protein